MGRPKKYTVEVIEKIRQALELYTAATDIPILAEFAYQNNVPRRTLYDFADNDDEFSHTIKELIDKKEAQLERKGLNKEIDRGMAIFSLKQLGWKDNQDVNHSGTLAINLIDDIPKVKNGSKT